MDNDAPFPDARAIAARLDRPVVLVGMMGVGKSSLGRRLASALAVRFTDADDEIERAAQMSIPEIFATYGESYFRDGERRVITRLIENAHGHGVIATGGGAFINAETRALILQRAVAIWLDSDVDTLLERTGRRGNRPLLQTGNPRETIERLRNERASAYAEAPIHIFSANTPQTQTLGKVLKGLDEWLS